MKDIAFSITQSLEDSLLKTKAKLGGTDIYPLWDSGSGIDLLLDKDTFDRVKHKLDLLEMDARRIPLRCGSRHAHAPAL